MNKQTDDGLPFPGVSAGEEPKAEVEVCPCGRTEHHQWAYRPYEDFEGQQQWGWFLECAECLDRKVGPYQLPYALELVAARRNVPDDASESCRHECIDMIAGLGDFRCQDCGKILRVHSNTLHNPLEGWRPAGGVLKITGIGSVPLRLWLSSGEGGGSWPQAEWTFNAWGSGQAGIKVVLLVSFERGAEVATIGLMSTGDEQLT